MVTTPENDWSTELKGVPWMQKARPGMRKVREGRPVPIATATATATAHSDAPAPVLLTSPAQGLKPPLSSDAQRTEEAEIASAENVFLMIVVVVLLLTMYWGTAAIVLGTASNRRNDALQIESTVLKKERAVAADAPESNSQSSATKAKNSRAQ